MNNSSVPNWAQKHWLSAFAEIGADPTKTPECLCAILHSTCGFWEMIPALLQGNIKPDSKVHLVYQIFISMSRTTWVASQTFPKKSVVQHRCKVPAFSAAALAACQSFCASSQPIASRRPCESTRVAMLCVPFLSQKAGRVEELFHICFFFLLSVMCWLEKLKLEYSLSCYNCCNLNN